MRDMDRDSALVALTHMGFTAQARDWALGRTLFVTLPELRVEHAGIFGAREAVYLHETPEAWGVVTLDSGLPERVFSTLAEAADFMRSWLECGLALRKMEALKLHVRRRPWLDGHILWVSRRELFFDDGNGVWGWRNALMLRREPGAWVVFDAPHGQGPVDEASFTDLDTAVDFVRERLKTE